MPTTITKSTKPYIYKTNKFETIIIRLIFPFEELEEDIAKNYLLPPVINKKCQKYDTEEELNEALINNYILSIGASYQVIGTTAALCYNMVLVDPKVINEDYLEKAIKTLAEYVYKPYVQNKSLDNDLLIRAKNNLLRNIDNSKKELRGYMAYRLPKLIDNENIYNRNISNYTHQFDQVNGENLYDHYKSIVKNQTPITFVCGNVNKNNINKLINKYFNKNNIKEITFDKNYECFLKPFRKEVQFITEEKDFKQSGIAMIYKVKDMSESDRTMLSVISMLLTSSSTMLLFNKLRTEEQLVYSANCNSVYYYGFLRIMAYVDKDKLDYAQEKIKELIKELKNEELIAKLLKLIVEDYEITILENQDNKDYFMNNMMFTELEIEIDPTEFLDNLKKIKAKDVSKFIDRLSLDTVYYVKEKKHE